MVLKDQTQQWKYPNLPPKPFSFARKPSLLDQYDPNSALNQSSIRGLYNLTIIFMFIFFITQPVVNFIDHGYFFNPILFDTFKVDFLFCIFTWPLFFAWSFTSLILQKLIIKGLGPTTALIFQHITQSGLFIYSLYVIMQNDWCSTHAVFVIIQACAHFMKMHSYVTVNRDYRLQYLQAIKNGHTPNSNYPNNVTVSDFCLFMFTPWLVYAQYPRRSKINWWYVFRKFTMVASLLLVIYLMHAEFIHPWILLGNKISFIQLILRLMLPSTAFILLNFYLVFENMCNFFAQITKLDHRQFYEDFWNSHTFEEFNRKWNKPVHIFLYRHVYLQLIVRWKTSKLVAQISTFFFSAMLHELLLAVVFRIVRFIFLGFILMQVPLIALTRWMKHSRAGIYLFWYGIVLGPTLIMVCYLRVEQSVTTMFARK